MSARVEAARQDRQVFSLEDGSRIRDLAVFVDHVKLTGEGKLEIKLTAEAIEGEALAKVRDLLLVMRGGVLVDVRPAQESLPM